MLKNEVKTKKKKKKPRLNLSAQVFTFFTEINVLHTSS